MNLWFDRIQAFTQEYPSRAYVLVFFISLLLFSLNIQGLSIYALDEAKNVEAAREMYEQKDFVVPTFNYELRTDKPPLHYYFMMLGFHLFGIHALGARFFGAFVGALMVGFTFRFSHKFIGSKAAWMSTLVLWASLHLSLQFHMAVPDPYLITCFCLSIYFFFEYLQVGKAWALIGFYLMMGLGVLTKGPIAIALPGLIMLLHLISSKRLSWKTIGQLKPWWGALIVLGVSLPWFILVHQATDGVWTEEFFFKHNFRRFSEPMEGHGGIFLLSFAFVIGGMLPFSVFSPQALGFSWKQRKETQALDISLCAVLAVIGFFALSSTKLPNYTVPCYPFLAILIGTYFAKNIEVKKVDRYSLWLYLILSLGIVPAAYFGLRADPIIENLAYLSSGLLWVPIGAIFATFLLWKQQRFFPVVVTLTLSWVVTAFLFYFFLFPKIDQRNPVLQTQHVFEDNPPVVQYQLINRAFMFALQKPIPVLAEEEDIVSHFRQYPDDLLIIRKAYWEKLDSVPKMEIVAESPDLFEKHTTLILRLDKSTK
ncbi:MAG: glycosyltransferase family 39 protein [Bacteroidota bacterium]